MRIFSLENLQQLSMFSSIIIIATALNNFISINKQLQFLTISDGLNGFLDKYLF
jgi:hypothetical protein